MSTKNLARTVIEGGRSGHSKYLRRISLRLMRARVRRACRAMTFDPERAEGLIWPLRDRDWDDIEHKDRTNPCERFLEARAGRRWNDVRSEICRRFDRRKLAGAHVTEDHLIARVEHGGGYLRLRWKFWVDAEGVLRHDPRERW